METECNMSHLAIRRQVLSYCKYVQGHKESECVDYKNKCRE